MAPSLTCQRVLYSLLLPLLLTLLLPLLAYAAVPNEKAVPAYAEEQTILQLEKGTPEPGLGSSASGRQHFDRHFIIVSSVASHGPWRALPVWRSGWSRPGE
jgi:hypothetical protein